MSSLQLQAAGPHQQVKQPHLHSRWQSKQTCAWPCPHLCSTGSAAAAGHVDLGQCRSMPSGGTCCPAGCRRVPSLPALCDSAACAAGHRGWPWLGGCSCLYGAWLAGWQSAVHPPTPQEDCYQATACMTTGIIADCPGGQKQQTGSMLWPELAASMLLPNSLACTRRSQSKCSMRGCCDEQKRPAGALQTNEQGQGIRCTS